MYRHPNARFNHIEEFSEALRDTINKITQRKGTFYSSFLFLIQSYNSTMASLV